MFYNRWDFLEPVQRTGSPLPREAIARRCSRDYGLLRFLCMSARRSAKAAAASGNSPSAQDESGDVSSTPVASSVTASGRAKLFSFYAAVVIEALGSLSSTNESLLRALVPDVVHGLTSTRSPEYQVRRVQGYDLLMCRQIAPAGVTAILGCAHLCVGVMHKF